MLHRRYLRLAAFADRQRFNMKILLLLALILAPSAPISAQDWNQWRGPLRNGSVADIPASWPKVLRQSWRVEVGEGYSSPIVSAGRVFIHSRRDPDEIVMAINLSDGKVLWQPKYTSAFQKNQYAVDMSTGPNAPPLVAGNRLFTLGVSAVLVAWDTNSGRELWKKDFSKNIDTSKLFCGTAASPLIVDGGLIVQVGSDIRGGVVLSLNPADGSIIWEWRGPGPGYASPVVINVGGANQIVTMTQESIVGLDARSGKELWSTPFPDEWHENIMTPIWTGSALVVSGPRQGTHAYILKQVAGKWQSTEAWHNSDVAMYMSSPVYGDGVIYGHSVKRKGQFVALEAKTGALKWATEGREGEYASVLLTPDHVVFLTNGAELIVAKRRQDKFTPEQRYEVANSATWSVPVLFGSDILLRDASSLIRLNGSL